MTLLHKNIFTELKRIFHHMYIITDLSNNHEVAMKCQSTV